MNISVTINNEKTILQTTGNESLAQALRKMNLLSIKIGCAQGFCGSCTVLLDEKPIPSCKLPAALANGKNIQTLEYFAKTKMYADISKGFLKAGIKLCEYCASAKYFAAREIILQKERPNRQKVQEYVKYLSPCCIDTNTLIDGIMYSYEYHNFIKEK